MIYERIRELCKQNVITITGLEKELGFAKGSLSKIDKHKPSAEKMRKLADRLNTTPDYILYGTLPEHKSLSGKVYYFDDETAKLAQKLHDNPMLNTYMSSTMKLKPDQIEAIQAMITAFLRKDGLIDDDD